MSSLFEYISSAAAGGVLPEGFSLPEITDSENRLKWVDGAYDGVSVYHMGFQEPGDDIAPLTAAALSAASEGDTDKADKLFCELGRKARALSVIDTMQEYIVEHHDELSAGMIYNYAVHLLTESDDRECVKTGFSLLEMLPTDDNEDLKDVIRTIGLSDEFTLFAIFVMRSWANGNDEIFRLAQKVHGWGRIHAIERLEPDTEEIRRWLLLEGVHNGVMPAYSALTCWQNSGAWEVLKAGPSREEFTGIRDIIEGMLDEGPVEGLSGLENRKEIALRFLEAAAGMACDPADYEIVRGLKQYFGNGENASPEVTALCERILDKAGRKE